MAGQARRRCIRTFGHCCFCLPCKHESWRVRRQSVSWWRLSQLVDEVLSTPYFADLGSQGCPGVGVQVVSGVHLEGVRSTEYVGTVSPGAEWAAPGGVELGESQ